MATLVSEKTKVTHLEKEIQNKEVALQTVMKELDSFKSTLIRDRMSSESSSSMADQDEIRRILSSPESDSDLALQNERLKYDLDKSIGERRLLSQQMENWKKQLTTTDEPTEESDEEDPVFIRRKQEQAYRSVGALQLRVEELTLEVTKVCFHHSVKIS